LRCVITLRRRGQAYALAAGEASVSATPRQ
jgi:hypothetical protein